MFLQIQIPNVSYFWCAQQTSAELISQYISMISIDWIVHIIIALVRTAIFVFDVIGFIHDGMRSYPMHG